MNDLTHEIEAALGQPVLEIKPLSGGCIAEVQLVKLERGDTVVAKVDDPKQSTLELEARMLSYLLEHSKLPVPKVLYNSSQLLIIEFLEGTGQLSPAAERHAAELLAELHEVRADYFGLDFDTLTGRLPQPNPKTSSWITFFREQRLLYAAEEAYRIGRLPQGLKHRLERLADSLEDYLHEPEHPSLIHGDVWRGNILTARGRVTGLLDPAIYYADAEMELAYIALFDTFSETFFARYKDMRALEQGFFSVRKDIYALYPLLVHVWHFGGSYVSALDTALKKLGY